MWWLSGGVMFSKILDIVGFDSGVVGVMIICGGGLRC